MSAAAKPRCGSALRNSRKCGRPEDHQTHHISEEAWELMRLRNARRIAALKLLDAYVAMNVVLKDQR